jgi:hypothetical protein
MFEFSSVFGDSEVLSLSAASPFPLAAASSLGGDGGGGSTFGFFLLRIGLLTASKASRSEKNWQTRMEGFVVFGKSQV